VFDSALSHDLAGAAAASDPTLLNDVSNIVNGGIALQVTQGYQDGAAALAGAGVTFESLAANGLSAEQAAVINAFVGAEVASAMPPLAAAIAGTQAQLAPGLIAQTIGGLSAFAAGGYTAGADGLAQLGGAVTQADGTYLFPA
jgi:hypothetical protein